MDPVLHSWDNRPGVGFDGWDSEPGKENTNTSEYALQVVQQGMLSNKRVPLAGRAGERAAREKFGSGEVQPDLDYQLDVVNRAHGAFGGESDRTAPTPPKRVLRLHNRVGRKGQGLVGIAR
jgi:hypothetical protein